MYFPVKEKYKKFSENKYRLRSKYWSGTVPVCVIYPNTYFLAMSNLGFQTIFYLFSNDSKFVVDRLFYPDCLSKNGVLSYETEHRLNEFFVLAFSISYENDYLNVLKILRAAGIPPGRKDRKDKFPLLIGGGPAVTINPGPLSEVFDAIFVGEVEDAFEDIAKKIVRAYERKVPKINLLEEFVEIDGMYVPHFKQERINRRIIGDINKFVPRTFIFTPDTEFSNMGVIEISRGCRWRCRFCVAPAIYFPARFRSAEVIKNELVQISSYCEKFGLLGALPTEHPEIEEITNQILLMNKKFSFSSVRIGALNDIILSNLRQGGEKSVTLAPETGSERLRKIINKPITNKAIFSQIEKIEKAGIKKIKLYFMLGLPFETEEDVYKTAVLLDEFNSIFPSILFTISFSIFVPKPQTPFQWAPFISEEVIKKNIHILKDEIRQKKNLRIEMPSYKNALMEAILSSGDNEFSCKLVNNISGLLQPADSLYSEKSREEKFFWDIIFTGIDRTELYKEYERAVSLHRFNNKIV